MNVILLCAGYATRLKPLTDSCPKPLLALADRPMLEYLADQVKKLPSLGGVYIVSNAKFQKNFETWKESYPHDFKLEVLNDGSITNDDRLGAIRDIAFVLDERNLEDDCLVLAGDNYFDFDLVDFIRFAERHKPNVTLAVYDVKDLNLAKRYGLVACDSKSRIRSFQEKPEHPESTLVSTGVYYFPEENLSMIRRYLKEHQNPDAPGHYVRWLVERSEVFAFSFSGIWYDIGDFESYRTADVKLRESFRLRGKDPK